MLKAVQERFLDKIRAIKKVEKVRGVRASVYTTFNEVWLWTLASGGTTSGTYWFGVDIHNIQEWRRRNRFVICFICGDESTVVFVPDDKLVEWFEGQEPNRKGQWMVTFAPQDGKMILKVSADKHLNVTEYINRYDFISKSIPPPATLPLLRPKQSSPSLEEIVEPILSSPDLVGGSLHDRVIDMLAQIGTWMGYVAEKDHMVAADSPYQLDVVWLDRGLMEVAVEVQVGGNETEAKDRLVLARRFGARKIIVVSMPDGINRLKNLCRYEPELKNWLEIWSVPKVYEMYLSGRKFFEIFRPFERQQWTEEINEIV